jgi:hypothetical protein
MPAHADPRAGDIVRGTTPLLDGTEKAKRSAPQSVRESPYVRIALRLGWRLDVYTGLVVHDTSGRRVSPLSKAR